MNAITTRWRDSTHYAAVVYIKDSIVKEVTCKSHVFPLGDYVFLSCLFDNYVDYVFHPMTMFFFTDYVFPYVFSWLSWLCFAYADYVLTMLTMFWLCFFPWLCFFGWLCFFWHFFPPNFYRYVCVNQSIISHPN